MGEYSRSARGSLVSTGALMAVTLPFEPQYVEITNFTSATTPTATKIAYTQWDYGMNFLSGAVSPAVNDVFVGTTPVALSTETILVGGISTFSAGLSLQFGPQKQVASATAANPIVFTVTAHGYVTGDVVIFEGLYQSPTTGMPQICGMPFVITVIDANDFSINWNGAQSSYTALSASPTGAFVRQVIYPFLYAPGVSNITSLTLGATTTVVTTAPHNLNVGSEVAFRIPKLWGTVQLNSPQNFRIPGSPVYGYVMSVISSTSVLVKLNSMNFTPFTTNIPVTDVPGLSFPQMVAVGDINSGGTPYSGGALYPSPVVNGVSTINGPGILGAFVNNTASGFVIGASVAGTLNDQLFWKAYLYDYSSN